VAARAAGLAALLAAVVLTLTAPTPLDYGSTTCRLQPHCDDAAPAINALAHGRVAVFFRDQRLMGPVSEVAQAPFVALADGKSRTRYRAGLFVCLLVLAAFGYVLARTAARRGWPWWSQLLVAVGAVWNPMTHWVIRYGHQEEIVAALLVIAAVAAARRGRAGAAGVLLGLSVATKLWTIAAVPLVLVAALPRAGRSAWTCAVTAVIVLGIAALASPATFRANDHQLGRLGSAPGTVSRTDAWFAAASPAVLLVPVAQDAAGRVTSVPENVFRAPRIIGPLGHALVLVAAVGMAMLLLRAPPTERWPALWLALALVLLLRCILDSGDRSYYHLPFLLALLAYEVEARRTAPWLALIACCLFEAFTQLSGHIHSDAGLGFAYCAWSVPLAIAMFVELRGTMRRTPAVD
jgi:hypothetical protein